MIRTELTAYPGAGRAVTAVREVVFSSVMSLSAERVKARMRLATGRPPGFVRFGAAAEPPGESFTRAVERMQQDGRPSEAPVVVDRLLALAPDLVKLSLELEDNNGSVDMSVLHDFVKQCYHATTANGGMTFQEALKKSGLDLDIWLNNKFVMQIDKIGAYWRIARSLAQDCRQMPLKRRFNRLVIELVPPFDSVTTTISARKQRVNCFVHAEVQMIAYYLMRHGSTLLMPRVLGASKSTCFLCGLFVKNYGRFLAPPTHGRLYDQWTIPDLADFGPAELDLVRRIIHNMNEYICKLSVEAIAYPRNRAYPLTSRQDLTGLPLSSMGASSSSTIRAPEWDSFARTASPDQGHKAGSDVVQPSTQVQGGHLVLDIATKAEVRPRGSAESEAARAMITIDASNDARQDWTELFYDVVKAGTSLTSALEIFVQIEAPARGRCEHITPPLIVADCNFRTIQMEALTTDQELSFEKQPHEEGVKLCFQSDAVTCATIKLQWM